MDQPTGLQMGIAIPRAKKRGPLCLCLKDAFAKGEVFLGNKDHGYNVSAGLPAGTHCNGAWQHGITIETPDRCFLFTCETESEQQDWLKRFSDVMSAQMSPQEYTSKNTEPFM